jgi:hypothetical protein
MTPPRIPLSPSSSFLVRAALFPRELGTGLSAGQSRPRGVL